MKTLPRIRSRDRLPLIGGILLFCLLAALPESRAGNLITGISWRESDHHRDLVHWDWVGLNRGNKVTFHRYTLMGGDRGKRPFHSINLAAPADEILYSDHRLGVRIGTKLQFFDASRGFKHLPKFDFELPEDTSELVLDGDRLGIRTGRTLKFYNISANFSHLPTFDFLLPEGVDELVLAMNSTGKWLGVRIGTQLIFHNIEQNYTFQAHHVFTVPPDTEEIAIAGLQLLVKSGNSIRFYDFGKRVMTRPRLQLDLE